MDPAVQGGDPAPCSHFGRRGLKKERNVRLNTASRLPTRPFYNTVTQGWDREDPCKVRWWAHTGGRASAAPSSPEGPSSPLGWARLGQSLVRGGWAL